MIKLSIITINLNNLSGLITTFNSVISQTYPNIEYIIVDGNSNDGSKEFIASNRNKVANYISEPDHGIYNAINKGIRLSSGDFILCLNSGDYLISNEVVSQAVEKIDESSDLVAFNVLYRTGELFEIKKNPKSVSVSYFTKHVLYHPGVLVSRKLHEKHDYYDENMRIAADWAFFLKVAGLNKCKYQYVPILFSVFCTNGISSNFSHSNIQTEERELFWSKTIPKSILDELCLLQKLSDEKKLDISQLIQKEDFSTKKFNQFKTEFRSGNRFKALLCLYRQEAGIQYKITATKMYLRSLFLKFYVY